MKLKYYLRGIGVGVVITTILFMIIIPLHRNDVKSQDAAKQNTESKTVADLKKETETEEERNTQKSSETGTEQKEKQDTKKQDTKDPDASDSSQKDTPKENAKQDAAEASKPETKPEEKPQEKVRIEISGGEFSDDICHKLEKTGLIDSAEAFNRFLIEKDYDNSIMPGTYDIPKDSTYEQIAVLLTTKVE